MVLIDQKLIMLIVIDLNYYHLDLKPENILVKLRSDKLKFDIRLCDITQNNKPMYVKNIK